MTADIEAVKAAFEGTYTCLGITCGDVGGYFNEDIREYFWGLEPCVDPHPAMAGYVPRTNVIDESALDDFDEMLRIAMSVRLDPLALRDDEIQAINAFLAALEDPQAGRGRLGAPYNVPSGIPVDTGPMDHGTGTASSSY